MEKLTQAERQSLPYPDSLREEGKMLFCFSPTDWKGQIQHAISVWDWKGYKMKMVPSHGIGLDQAYYLNAQQYASLEAEYKEQFPDGE